MMTNEQCYSLAVEKLLNIDIPERAKWIRGKCTVLQHSVSLYCVVNKVSFSRFLFTWSALFDLVVLTVIPPLIKMHCGTSGSKHLLFNI